MAFRTLNPEFRARREMISATMNRLHAMTDPFLARNVLKMTREARSELPERLGNPSGPGYDVLLVWQIVPILAKRVSGCALLPNEGRDPEWIQESDQGLRNVVGQCLNNSEMSRWAMQSRPKGLDKISALELISREFVNGNPIAILADRVCAPAPSGEDKSDWLAQHMREISRARFGDERFSAWSPEFQNYTREASLVVLKAMEEVLDDMDRGPSAS